MSILQSVKRILALRKSDASFSLDATDKVGLMAQWFWQVNAVEDDCRVRTD